MGNTQSWILSVAIGIIAIVYTLTFLASKLK